MCGRYTLAVNDLAELMSRFGCRGVAMEWQPRFNVAPTQVMPVVMRETDENRLKAMGWGLVPFWAKDRSIGSRLINARVESLAQKPAFRRSLLNRRCIVPADGYYEWKKAGRVKIPMRIVSRSDSLFGMAGLWDVWRSPAGETVETYTIITTAAAGPVAYIHDRMPLILPRDMEQRWLGDLGEREIAALLGELTPVRDLRAYQVSRRVNSPAHDSPDLIEAVSIFDPEDM